MIFHADLRLWIERFVWMRKIVSLGISILEDKKKSHLRNLQIQRYIRKNAKMYQFCTYTIHRKEQDLEDPGIQCFADRKDMLHEFANLSQVQEFKVFGFRNLIDMQLTR